jgi:hypothetical protein
MNAVITSIKSRKKATVVRTYDRTGWTSPALVCCSEDHADECVGTSSHVGVTVLINEFPEDVVCAVCDSPIKN